MSLLNRFKKSDSEIPVKKKALSEAKLPDVQVAKNKSVKAGSLSAVTTDVVVKPLVTEKTAVLASNGKYVFVVSGGANRVQVKIAINEMFGVMPTFVNIQNVRGKRVRFGKRHGKRSDWKKAIVTLPKGQKINVYEGV
ncbi:MAG: 50S ribosomal protein L23 [Parcubacteria group bacterium]|nr:50S ribosomal protein L23 [Parcubacteria group bacterium]